MKMLNKFNKKQSGFTLLELLVVVGIIAIIGGAMIASFSGNEVKAARGVATQTIAGLESTMRIFEVEKQGLPNNLESLVCAPYDAAGVVTTIWDADALINPKATTAVVSGTSPNTAAATGVYKFGGESNVAGIGGGMSKKLAEKFVGYNLSAAQAEALNDLGMTSLRYAIAAACDTDIATKVTSLVANGTTSTTFGDSAKGLAGIDIPNLAFSDPRPSNPTTFKLRGVGFSGNVAENTPVLRWWRGSVDADANGYNNIKVGAGADDVLIALGIGQDTDFIGIGENARMSKAPFYGQVPRDKYAHYIGLFNLSNSTIRLQAVVDARGDFLDEEIAEFQGQKT